MTLADLLQNLGADPNALRWYQQAELVHCRTATAFTPLLIPRMPSRWNISRAIWNVDGPLPPLASSCLCLVISTVFMNVQNPIVVL